MKIILEIGSVWKLTKSRKTKKHAVIRDILFIHWSPYAKHFTGDFMVFSDF